MNHTFVSKESYSEDRKEILSLINFRLLKHEEFLNDPNSTDSTEIIIDSILYSPDLEKLEVTWIGPNFSNSSDKERLSKEMRDDIYPVLYKRPESCGQVNALLTPNTANLFTFSYCHFLLLICSMNSVNMQSSIRHQEELVRSGLILSITLELNQPYLI